MRHRPWHKVWQDRLLSDADYLSLRPAERGVLADLRCFAARKADGGNTGQTVGSLLQWYGTRRKSAAKGIQTLAERKLIVITNDTRLISIPKWDEAQESASASRMRALRARTEAASHGRHSDGHCDGPLQREMKNPVAPTDQMLPRVEIQAQRLAASYKGYSANQSLADRCAAYFREGIEGGLSPEDIDAEIVSGDKLATPWEIIQRVRGQARGGNGQQNDQKQEAPELYVPIRPR